VLKIEGTFGRSGRRPEPRWVSSQRSPDLLEGKRLASPPQEHHPRSPPSASIFGRSVLPQCKILGMALDTTLCCLLAVVPVTIERKSGTGAFGTVSVTYETLAPAESYPFLPRLDPRARRADYADYVSVSDAVGQTNASVNVTIKANNHSRPDSVLFLRLKYLVLLQPQQTRPSTCGSSFVVYVYL